jgi:hypothetical protein
MMHDTQMETKPPKLELYKSILQMGKQEAGIAGGSKIQLPIGISIQNSCQSA